MDCFDRHSQTNWSDHQLKGRRWLLGPSARLPAPEPGPGGLGWLEDPGHPWQAPQERSDPKRDCHPQQAHRNEVQFRWPSRPAASQYETDQDWLVH